MIMKLEEKQRRFLDLYELNDEYNIHSNTFQSHTVANAVSKPVLIIGFV